MEVRELFYEVKIPNLVFYNQAFSDRVIREAPDFWRYRGNYYEFEEVERGMAFEAIETLAAPFSYQDKADLLRRKRINEYLLERVRDQKGKANLLSELGTICYHQGELDTALNYHEKALDPYEDMGIKEEMAAVLGNIGIVHRIKGELDNALDYHKEALKLNAELGRKDGMTADYGNIGNVYYDKRELEKASEYYEKTLKLNEELGMKDGVAIQLGNIGLVHYRKGELYKAFEYLEKALRMFKELGSRIETARALMSIGDVLLMKGDKERAIAYYREAQGLAAGSYLFEEVSKRLKRLT